MAYISATAPSETETPTIISILTGQISKFKNQIAVWSQNAQAARALKDLSDKNLRDIGMTRHDVSQVSEEYLSAKEALMLSELRRVRSLNW